MHPPGYQVWGPGCGAQRAMATYPEVIVLTGLFTSPHWRDHPNCLQRQHAV
ncbi:hypothetical protein [Streptomyces sp. R33]|uniref:Uncharacterized protein n=1 Tax=Streptomyces sp. R33 TaxID=3238629 RepID=A0AB39YDJ9_9ACTN